MIWRACERFKLVPPGVKTKWDDNEPWNQALLLAYEEVRNIEEADENQMAGVGVMAMMLKAMNRA